MFASFITLFVVCWPASCMLATAWGAAADEGPPGVITIMRSPDADGRAAVLQAVPPDGSKTRSGYAYVVSSSKADESAPKVWIGVRLTPVPTPLAAHVGEKGAMISNVVKESPADAAGLEQYDVLVAFGDHEIAGAQDLTNAVAKSQAGTPVNITVIRKGARQNLSITPTERPKDSSFELKYDEPEDQASVDAAVELFGRTLERGPHGEWTWKDLGRLHALPEGLRALEELKLDLGPKSEGLAKFYGLGDALKDLDVRILHNLDDGCIWHAEEEGDAQVQVTVRADEDGKTTTIVKNADGRIEVTKSDAEGHETSATYENAEEFEKADPDAYKLYCQYATGRGSAFLFRGPSAAARAWRHDFKVDVEKRVQQALEKARAAQERAADAAKEAQDMARRYYEDAVKEHRKRVEIHTKTDDAKPGAQRERLALRVRDDGSIVIEVTENGDKSTYEFKDREAFKTAKPELYERVKSMLE